MTCAEKNALYYSLIKSWVNTFWINLVTDMTDMFLCTTSAVTSSSACKSPTNTPETNNTQSDLPTRPTSLFSDWLNVWSRHCSVWQSYSFFYRGHEMLTHVFWDCPHRDLSSDRRSDLMSRSLLSVSVQSNILSADTESIIPLKKILGMD